MTDMSISVLPEHYRIGRLFHSRCGCCCLDDMDLMCSEQGLILEGLNLLLLTVKDEDTPLIGFVIVLPTLIAVWTEDILEVLQKELVI